MKKSLILVLSVIVFGLNQTSVASASATKISFSGYQWIVRSGSGGPGPNLWSASNVWVDANGYLHLKITNVGGQWYAAELFTTSRLNFGKYQFNVDGPVDRLDPNVVLGLFNYPTADVGPDGTNEIDIEFSHWGNLSYPIGNYTVWPAISGPANKHRAFDFSLNRLHTTQRFTWNSKQIYFQSLRGFHNDNTGQYNSWNFQPSSYLKYIPQHAMPLHINLWLFNGAAPTNGQEVEVVIRSFHYSP